MSEYATSGAMLLCTCGMLPTPLQVSSNTLTLVQGQYIATTADCAPIANIVPFGLCKMKPTIAGFLPCIPVPSAWTGFLASIQILGNNPLLKTSTIACGCGGMILFQDSGQKKNNKVLINPSSPQITALKKAAIAGTPFCEECEKKNQQEKKIRAIDVYWMDDESDKRHYDVFPDYEVTLYVETIDYTEGESISLDIFSDDGMLFKGKKDKITISGNTNAEGIVCVQNFKIEYE